LGSCTRKNNAPKTKKLGFWERKNDTPKMKKLGIFFSFSTNNFLGFWTRKNTQPKQQNWVQHTLNNKFGFCVQARPIHPKRQKGFFWVCTRKNNGRCYGWVIDLRGEQLSSDWFRWTSQLDSTNFDWISFGMRIWKVGFSPPLTE
jgi:hypothetical protein